MKTTVRNIYSKRAEERRRQFNRLMNSCNMVLINNIPEVDPSVWDNFEGSVPHDDEEVAQWYAVSDSDADFLKRHGQYITYSDMLSAYFLAITHYGTSWDYVESMVEAFEDCYVGLEDLSDDKE